MLFDCCSICLFRCEGEFDEDDDCEEVLVGNEWRDDGLCGCNFDHERLCGDV